MRHANFAVQNADLILSVGSRLDTKSTGSPINTFAREAKKIIVDIDHSELGKFSQFGLDIDLLVEEDLRIFFKRMSLRLLEKNQCDTKEWLEKIVFWRKSFTASTSVPNNKSIDPYNLFKSIPELLDTDSTVFIDTGCSIAWAMQSMNLREGQRIYHDFNNTAMGWSLPAAIGGYFSKQSKQIVCIIGDGSLMMTIQELATIMHHNIPLKIILINNSGYSMIKQTQDQWLSSNYIASSKKGGLSFPNFALIAEAYDIKYFILEKSEDTYNTLSNFLSLSRSAMVNIVIPPEARVNPQVKYGRPNEDMEPLLPRDQFLKNMIIEPLPVSKNI